MDKKEEAKQNFKMGYNCSQAVLKTFADELQIDEQTLLKLGSPFGGGMARMRETCGVVSAVAMILGLLYGNTDIKNNEEKEAIYKLTRQAAERFKSETGSINCGELLGLNKGEDTGTKPSERTEAYYKKRPCAELCALGTEIIESIIQEKQAKTL